MFNKAFYSIDALIASVIVIYMFFYALQLVSLALYDRYVYEYKMRMERLFIASEYFVLHNSVSDYKKHPNVLREDFSYSTITIDNVEYFSSLNEIEDKGDCIVRYVLHAGKIKKLYVCLE